MCSFLQFDPAGGRCDLHGVDLVPGDCENCLDFATRTVVKVEIIPASPNGTKEFMVDGEEYGVGPGMTADLLTSLLAANGFQLIDGVSTEDVLVFIQQKTGLDNNETEKGE